MHPHAVICLCVFWMVVASSWNGSAAASGDAATPIEDGRFVTLGGIEQWVTIKGDRRDLPIVLFLHGGPGNPTSLWSESLYAGWSRSFTLVQWDQRCAGRSYARNLPVEEELSLELFYATELTVDRLTRDGIELAEYLIRTLGQERIILTGTSWGSVLGLHMIKARPDLFHAYVGVSQLVSYADGLARGYDRVLALAREQADADAVAELESLGPPPWENPRSFGRFRRVIRRYEAARTSPAVELEVVDPVYETNDYRAAYAAGEELSFLKFVGLKNDGMAAGIDFLRADPRYDVPIFLIQGEEDLLTVPEVTEAFYERIEAPAKALIRVPAAGHDPNVAMLKAQFDVLADRIAPRVRRPVAP